jgi:hypothetical protein
MVMLNILMRLLLGLIIIGDRPIFIIEKYLNLMGGLEVHDLTKYATIHRSIENISSLAIEMKAFTLHLSCFLSINHKGKAYIYDSPHLRTNKLKIALHPISPPCKVCAIKNVWTLNIYPISCHPLGLVKTTNERPGSDTT